MFIILFPVNKSNFLVKINVEHEIYVGTYGTKGKEDLWYIKGSRRYFWNLELKPLTDSQFDNVVEDLAVRELHDDEFNILLITVI